MRRNLLGAVFVVVVFGGGWLLLLGPRGPCDAMRAEAGAVADQLAGDAGRALRARFIEAPADRFTLVQCIATAVSLRVRGAASVEVVQGASDATPRR